MFSSLSYTAAQPSLPSFPTRRSSDLAGPGRVFVHPHRARLSGRVLPAVSGRRVRIEPLRERVGLIPQGGLRSQEHTSELQSRFHLACRRRPENKKRSSTTHRRRGSGG